VRSRRGRGHLARALRRSPLATAGAYQPVKSSFEDIFIAKLSADGSQLLYSTYLGGSSEEGGSGIAVDPEGNAYVT